MLFTVVNKTVTVEQKLLDTMQKHVKNFISSIFVWTIIFGLFFLFFFEIIL